MLLKILLFILCLLGVFLSLVLLYALILWVSNLFVDKKKPYYDMHPYYCALLNFTDDLIVFFSRVKVRLEGAEKLPEDSLYLLVSNHRSLYDPICVAKVLRRPQVMFVSKPENFRIPFGGKLAWRCCYRPIDRENPRNAITTIQDCAKLLNEKVAPVVIYPEGTRSRTGELLPFHDGIFKIAQHAKVPVAVMTVSGTEKIKNNFPWKRSSVILKIVEVIPAEAIAGVRTAEIGRKVREIMEADLQDKP